MAVAAPLDLSLPAKRSIRIEKYRNKRQSEHKGELGKPDESESGGDFRRSIPRGNLEADVRKDCECHHSEKGGWGVGFGYLEARFG